MGGRDDLRLLNSGQGLLDIRKLFRSIEPLCHQERHLVYAVLGVGNRLRLLLTSSFGRPVSLCLQRVKGVERMP